MCTFFWLLEVVKIIRDVLVRVDKDRGGVLISTGCSIVTCGLCSSLVDQRHAFITNRTVLITARSGLIVYLSIVLAQ